MQLVFRAAAAYWILLFAVRLIGRRTASQMAPFDLVVLFLFAGITITPVLADDHSMVGAFSGICMIGLMHILVSWLKIRSDLFGRIVDGTPVVVFEHGAFNWRRMSQLRLTHQDVMAAARQRGLMRLDQVRYAVAERDGKISIVQAEPDQDGPDQDEMEQDRMERDTADKHSGERHARAPAARKPNARESDDRMPAHHS